MEVYFGPEQLALQLIFSISISYNSLAMKAFGTTEGTRFKAVPQGQLYLLLGKEGTLDSTAVQEMKRRYLQRKNMASKTNKGKKTEMLLCIYLNDKQKNDKEEITYNVSGATRGQF